VELSQGENSSDDDDEEDRVYDSNDLPTLRRSSLLKQPQDSITNQILKEKRARDKALLSERLIQKNIFGIWAYKEERCDNRKGYCYVLKSTGNHYRVTTPQQALWAQAIANNQKGAILNPPPPSTYMPIEKIEKV
jgi:hypothetical protein